MEDVEHGVPELAVEILSPSDTPERWAFQEKLERYQELGVRELVCANLDAAPGARVRVWDRIEEDLVERVVEGDQTPCQALGLLWVLGPADDQPLALRLASAEGALLPSPREAAAGRIAELEEELRRARARP